MKSFVIVSKIVYLVIIGVWISMFFYAKQMATDLLPIVLVLSFVNIDSRIDEIVRELKGVKSKSDK